LEQEDMADNEIVKEIQRGNPETFKQFVDHFHHQVLNTCYGFVHHKEDAEDIAQEVFLEVYQSIANFREEAQLSTWIYRIAVTKSLDFLRKQKRQKRFGYIRNILGLENQVEQVPAPQSANPQTTLENQERARILQQAVNSLAENQKIAITLHNYEGFSYQEIADIMGVSVSAVESLIHRAKTSLQKKLYHYYAQHL
jgi:RNA polymerase sigma-70 factor (ECF subfamily)